MEAKEFRNEEKYILNLLYIFGEVDGRTKMQKLFYLLRHKYKKIIPFEYSRHFYGPFSSSLHETILSLVRKNLIEERSFLNVGYSYSLTNLGKASVFLGLVNLPSNVIEILKILNEEYSKKSREEIVSEVYQIAGIK